MLTCKHTSTNKNIHVCLCVLFFGVFFVWYMCVCVCVCWCLCVCMCLCVCVVCLCMCVFLCVCFLICVCVLYVCLGGHVLSVCVCVCVVASFPGPAKLFVTFNCCTEKRGEIQNEKLSSMLGVYNSRPLLDTCGVTWYRSSSCCSEPQCAHVQFSPFYHP